jgi:hypothetical protein
MFYEALRMNLTSPRVECECPSQSNILDKSHPLELRVQHLFNVSVKRVS